MKIWYVLRWVYQALLAELRKWKGENMVVTNTFYLTAESYRQWLEANPTAVSVDANNVQKSPLVIRSWSGEGSDKTAYPVYLTLQVESVAGTSAEVLYTYKSSSKVSEYTYTLPSDKYATANRITVSAYDDAARTKAVGSVQLNILADNPVPYPRAEEWSASLTYKNGEYLKVGDVLYMWTSRVPGNTTTDPKTWIQQNPTSKLWTEYPYNTLLAGQILLFDFAKIGQAIFQNQYMISQHGVDADGNESDDYRNFGKKRYDPNTGKSQDLFTPNILINFLTGYASMNNIMIRGTTINPFVGVNDATFPSPTGKGSNIICTVGKNTLSKTLLMESVEYTTKQMNGLRFFVLVRIAASSTGYDGDRFQLSFWGKADGDNTWPTCFVIPGVTTKGRTIGVKKSTILDLMFIPKVYNEDGLIHRIADIHVFNYDSSYMTVTDWDDSNFSTLPSESDFVEL